MAKAANLLGLAILQHQHVVNLQSRIVVAGLIGSDYLEPNFFREYGDPFLAFLLFGSGGWRWGGCLSRRAHRRGNQQRQRNEK